MYGKKFIARTDHKALVFLNSTRKPISPQFQTWMAALSEYDFDLRYRKGENHSNADGLSRINETLCSQCKTRHDGAKTEKPKTKYLAQIQIKSEIMQKIQEAQYNDAEIVKTFRFLNGEITLTSAEFWNKHSLSRIKDKLKVIDNMLMLEKENGLAAIIPKDFAAQFVKTIHEELCHLGSKKTFAYLNDSFYWPDMFNTIKKILKECIICAKRKIDQSRTNEFLLSR